MMWWRAVALGLVAVEGAVAGRRLEGHHHTALDRLLSAPRSNSSAPQLNLSAEREASPPSGGGRKKHYAPLPMGLDFLESMRVTMGCALLLAVVYWCRSRKRQRRSPSPPPSSQELEPLLLKVATPPPLDENDSLDRRKKLEEILDDDLWTALDDDLDDRPQPHSAKRDKRRNVRRLRPAYRRDDFLNPRAS